MDDLISRKALLNDYFNKWDGHVTSLPTLINSQPSARKKGHWNHVGFMVIECSECKIKAYELVYTNFCPNCGADMREEQT